MKVKFNFEQVNDFAERVGNEAAQRKHYTRICKELMDELRQMIIDETPVRMGELGGTLREGWKTKNGKASYLIRKNSKGYSVTIYNRVPYAYYVNYGHYSYNQVNVGSGNPYVVKNRTVLYYDGNEDATFVYGHFFVEKAVLEMENNDAVMQKILDNGLKQWWDWCVHGK